MLEQEKVNLSYKIKITETFIFQNIPSKVKIGNNAFMSSQTIYLSLKTYEKSLSYPQHE